MAVKLGVHPWKGPGETGENVSCHRSAGLQTEEGVAELYFGRRMAHRRVCSPLGRAQTLRKVREQASCQNS
jgi:hypothetical protein